MKKVLTMLICAIYLCFITLPVGATTQTLENAYADFVENAVVISLNSNGSYTYTIPDASLSEIQRMSTLIRERGICSVNSLNDKLLTAMGFGELEIAALRADGIDDVLTDAGFIVANVTYYKYDAMRDTSFVISESQYNELLDVTNVTRSNGSSTSSTADGLYTITTIATYLPNYIRDDWEDIEEDGWFKFYGLVTHNTYAFNRYTDAISLYADPANISWGDTSSDFSSSMSYTIGDADPTVENKVSADRHIGIGGAYYTWDFPPLVNVAVSITGYGRVTSYNNSCVFDVYTGYVDYFEESNTEYSFSFGFGGVGVSVSHGNEECANEYYGRCQVRYNP